MVKAAIFLSGSLILIAVSRRALRDPRSHGFYRFFAWEALFGLLLLNLSAWFKNPFTWNQIISWLLLLASLGLVIASLRLLRASGKSDPTRADPALLSLEKTAQLVTSGLYRWIRHPMYSSLFILGWGIFFKAPSWPGALLAVAASACLAATARIEERENVAYFGSAYRDYMRHSKRFIPYIL